MYSFKLPRTPKGSYSYEISSHAASSPADRSAQEPLSAPTISRPFLSMSVLCCRPATPALGALHTYGLEVRRGGREREGEREREEERDSGNAVGAIFNAWAWPLWVAPGQTGQEETLFRGRLHARHCTAPQPHPPILHPAHTPHPLTPPPPPPTPPSLHLHPPSPPPPPPPQPPQAAA